MRGVSIKRALPSNVIDIFDLFVKMNKNGETQYPKPSPEQVKDYYFMLLGELASPTEFFFIAKRGRVNLGFISAQLVKRPFGTTSLVFIKYLYVTDKKRRLGIGRKLIGELVDLCKNKGIEVAEFLCDDQSAAYWEKKIKAKKVSNLMRVERNQS